MLRSHRLRDPRNTSVAPVDRARQAATQSGTTDRARATTCQSQTSPNPWAQAPMIENANAPQTIHRYGSNSIPFDEPSTTSTLYEFHRQAGHSGSLYDTAEHGRYHGAGSRCHDSGRGPNGIIRAHE